LRRSRYLARSGVLAHRPAVYNTLAFYILRLSSFMEIENIQSIEDLSDSGNISDLVKEIKTLISPLTIEVNTYDELFKIVMCLQKNWLPLIKGPFISRQAEVVYYLSKLEGKQRNLALGISDDLYDDPEKAKKWFRELAQLVHPDKGGTATAFKVLKKLYDVMVDVKEDENE